jgi:integrase
MLAVTTGLRRSELFALKWKDVDFANKQLHVTRSIVDRVVGACKAESSQKPVPAHDGLIAVLRGWHHHLFDAPPIHWCRTENNAGATASLDDSRDA